MSQYDSMMKEIDSLDIDEGVVNALSELLYTAEETGVLPFAVSHEDCSTIIALVRLAEKYGDRNSIPKRLRM